MTRPTTPKSLDVTREFIKRLFPLLDIPSLIKKLGKALVILLETSVGFRQKYHDYINREYGHVTENTLRSKIILQMFQQDFLKKEARAKHTIDHRRLSNASIMHLVLQIISQIGSKELNQHFVDLIKRDAVWNQIRSDLDDDANADNETDKRVVMLDHTEIESMCDLDPNEIKKRIKTKIKHMKEDLIFGMFEIYIQTYSLNNSLRKHNPNSWNILLYNKSYDHKTLVELVKKYRLIMCPKVTKPPLPSRNRGYMRNGGYSRNSRNSRDGQLWIKTKSQWRLNPVCEGNETRVWQLLAAAVWHCSEQRNYMALVLKSADEHVLHHQNALIESNDALVETLNSISYTCYGKHVTGKNGFLDDLEAQKELDLFMN